MQTPTAAGCTGREKINWSGSLICRDAAQLLSVTEEREEGAHPTLRGWDGAPARGMQEMTARLPLNAAPLVRIRVQQMLRRGGTKLIILQRCYLCRNSTSLQTVSDGSNFPVFLRQVGESSPSHEFLCEG